MKRIPLGDYFARQGWYPAGREACERQIAAFRAEVDARAEALPAAPPGRAGVVPHAGWVFSGQLAALTIAGIARAVPEAETVVLFGGHLGPRSRPWILHTGTWPTPLGDIPVDGALAEALARDTSIPAIGAEDYEPDNTIELQMPLIRAWLPKAAVVPVGVPASAQAIEAGQAAVAAAAALGRTIAVVGSTDLTHYGPNYGFEPMGRGPEAVRWAREVNDGRAIELMTALEAETLLREALERQFCCCPGAVAATLSAARAAGAAQGQLLQTASSYDIRPDASFVGYAALVA